MLKQIVLATTNAGKIAEFKTLLAPIECISQQDLHIPSIEENGLSFVENALLKARHVSGLTNEAALADDSGLVVPALNGEPGIYSARYARRAGSDQDNISYLLQQLMNTPAKERHAFFYCALVLVKHATDPTPLIAFGQWHGMISTHPEGDQGFGYDPVFYLNNEKCTVAQLSQSVKNKHSHRAKALQSLCSQLLGRQNKQHEE